MFIHIGDNHVIQSRDIVSIIDRNVVSASQIMEDMISHYQKENLIFGPIEEAKSIVITVDSIYYSTLSVPTLKKRASMISTIQKLDDYSEELELESKDL